MQALFLASTVCAMHRNAHIWNASHPLLVTYYCWVTVYSPSMKAKKKSQNQMTNPGTRMDNTWGIRTCVCPLCYLWNRTRWVIFSFNKCRLLTLQITTCAEHGKIQLTLKITNHLFTCYLNCTCKSNPVCLIQQWSVIFLLASYVQWHYFRVWAYAN